MFNLPIIPHNLNPYLAYVFRWKHIRITQRPYCALRFLMLKISGKNCGRDFARELFSLFNNPPDKIKGMEMRATTHEGMLQQLKKLEKRGLIEILNVKEERQRLFLLEFLLIGNRKEALGEKELIRLFLKRPYRLFFMEKYTKDDMRYYMLLENHLQSKYQSIPV